MAKGRKTGGRRPGSVNKTTASVKEALSLAFDDLGGRTALVGWARRNKTEFFKLWAKLLPQDLQIAGKYGGPIEIEEVIVRTRIEADELLKREGALGELSPAES